jgi:hypothetical protein
MLSINLMHRSCFYFDGDQYMSAAATFEAAKNRIFRPGNVAELVSQSTPKQERRLSPSV